MTSSTPPDEPTYADRTYRSGAAMVAGVLLLLLIAWLLGDALFTGEGRAPWQALSATALVAPLVIALTLRPAVLAGTRRILVRNPFRTITLPWSAVEGIRAAYSTELYTTGGTKYQVWALPVSLRDRKRALRQSTAAQRGGGLAEGQVRPAAADQAVSELRQLAHDDAELRAAAASQGIAAPGGPEVSASVRWAWEIIAPAVAGAIALAVLFATG
ncbi:PH domain-containing protein [Streptomyces sp. AM 2-1-1]|uniref:PH domain-containing protein n=1 Tax=Streptomyces sp. AM 2-1-1 TaxID=3028709 RepID=UPI0023BA18B6|nr:PH domain-containing protein [Streptomyces sp. AM 2-1-1]WEH39989.1 PH domain-containing protein [Streptomyces sp. AM 2-1-1]